ncbi:MAG: hypothetical protein HWN81_08315 [Candidatus Lokiarchaeota archaeon]|nr:hypothetical protein [Candidatus Lokiarchaeota archaeon]
MYNETEKPSSEYEITINKLSNQIEELFSKIHYYQALIAEKEFQIKQLIKDNQNLIAKVQKLTHQPTPPPEPSQESYTPPTFPSNSQPYTPPTPPPIPIKQPESSFSLSEDPRINKRVCPNCGAMGFAIREVDDKSKVLSYSPRRMYAKKKECTKCRYEW